MSSLNSKDQFVRTATELFSRYGTRRVTVQEICKTAGISKVTFYKHFSNKSDLIRTIRDGLIDKCFAKFDEISAKDIPFVDKTELMTQWRMAFFKSMSPEFIRDLYLVDDVVEKAKQQYLKNIVAAQQRGEVRSDLSPDFIWLVTETLHGIIKNESWKAVFTEYSEFQRQMRTLFFMGLLSRKTEPE